VDVSDRRDRLRDPSCVGAAAPVGRRQLVGLRYQFVDCRWELGSPGRGHELYVAGHVPGASFLDVDTDLSSAPGKRGRHPLPEPDQFARAAARAGIGAGVFVVAYGNMGGAERLWWLLRHFGHDDCAVMDLEGWHGPLVSGEGEIQSAEFVPRLRDDDTIEAHELARGRDGLVVVDARLSPRWRGEPNDRQEAGSDPGCAQRTVE
jgi:thiosulfate/3-mercaptopyruvate sulfurtransferase